MEAKRGTQGRRWGRRVVRLLTVAAGAFALLALADAAEAARVDMFELDGRGYVKFQADPGETNNVSVSRCTGSCTTNYDWVDVYDPGVSVRGGWGFMMPYGCDQLAPDRVRCKHGSQITEVILYLEDGDDRVTVQPSVPSRIRTWASGANGNDTFVGGAGADRFNGGRGADVLSGNGGADWLEGGDGNDSLDGGAGNDTLWGDSPTGGDTGDDYIAAGPGADRMVGGPGVDVVDYRARTAALHITLDDAANDGEANEFDNVEGDVERIYSGAGDDTIVGNTRHNFIDGGPGNDTIDGGRYSDDIVGGDGTDTVSYRTRTAAVTVTLGDALANDGEMYEADKLLEIENALGGTGDDRLYGSTGANVLDGGTGDDELRGNGGPDRLLGGSGTDRMYADDGDVDDVLDCGGGHDFAYSDAVEFYRGYETDAVAGCEQVTWTWHRPTVAHEPRRF